MALATVVKVGLGVLVLPATCMLLCAARVEPIHGWMMRHECPIAKMTMRQPAHPIGLSIVGTARVDHVARPRRVRRFSRLPSTTPASVSRP